MNKSVFIIGKLWRRRTIIQASQGDGRPCSSQLEQWKPCPVKPCYSWRYSAWSPCKSEVHFSLFFSTQSNTELNCNHTLRSHLHNKHLIWQAGCILPEAHIPTANHQRPCHPQECLGIFRIFPNTPQRCPFRSISAVIFPSVCLALRAQREV